MKHYIVHLTNGERLTIDEYDFSMMQEHLTTGNPQWWKRQDENMVLFNFDHILYILPEQEVTTGVTRTPSPDDLRTQKRKDMEEILKNPKAIIKRATELHEREQE
jgi:hypothetical protein